MKDEPSKTVFEKKRDRRRELAKLPFEKKIEIVVELQKAAAGIKKGNVPPGLVDLAAAERKITPPLEQCQGNGERIPIDRPSVLPIS